jgi:hypothetical protein
MCTALEILFKEEYEEARAEVYKSLAREMLLDGKPDAEILRYSRLSEAELNVLKGECLKDGLK